MSLMGDVFVCVCVSVQVSETIEVQIRPWISFACIMRIVCVCLCMSHVCVLCITSHTVLFYALGLCSVTTL